MNEYGVPIMFDVEAESRDHGAVILVDQMAQAALPGVTGIVSWWTIEARDKRVDRNDNDPGVVLFDSGPGTRKTVALTVTGPDVRSLDAEVGAMLQFLSEGGVVTYIVHDI